MRQRMADSERQRQRQRDSETERQRDSETERSAESITFLVPSPTGRMLLLSRPSCPSGTATPPSQYQNLVLQDPESVLAFLVPSNSDAVPESSTGIPRVSTSGQYHHTPVSASVFVAVPSVLRFRTSLSN
eukprot:508826-Rhodomonas_salina.1